MPHNDHRHGHDQHEHDQHGRAEHGRNQPAVAGPDPELAGILQVVTGHRAEFGHREHLHLAFLAIQRHGMPAATGKVCDWIRALARYQQHPQKYHHTMSRAWVEIVAWHLAADPDVPGFAAFAERNAALLDKRLLTRHYRSATLAAAAARASWVPPDLAPFPWQPRVPWPARVPWAPTGSASEGQH